MMLSFSGCTPHYQKLEVIGYKPSLIVNGKTRSYGHSEQRLGHGWYRIQVLGHANAPKHWLKRIAEARAAELTLNHKQKYFLLEAVDIQINCAFSVLKHERYDNKKKKKDDEDRRDDVDVSVIANTADRIVFLTFRIAGQLPRPGLRDAQQTFVQELKVLAGPQPLKTEKQAAYEAAMVRCRAMADDYEASMNDRPSLRKRGSWTERVSVPN